MAIPFAAARAVQDVEELVHDEVTEDAIGVENPPVDRFEHGDLGETHGFPGFDPAPFYRPDFLDHEYLERIGAEIRPDGFVNENLERIGAGIQDFADQFDDRHQWPLIREQAVQEEVVSNFYNFTPMTYVAVALGVILITGIIYFRRSS